MNGRARTLVFLAMTLALVLGFTAHWWNPVARQVDRAPVACEEDQVPPCWNCHTMGNRICGPGH